MTIFEEIKPDQLLTFRSYLKCGDSRCTRQMDKIKVLPRTVDMYKLYNVCNKCKSLWEKNVLRCGHCNSKLRMKSRHRLRNTYKKTEEQLGIVRID